MGRHPAQHSWCPHCGNENPARAAIACESPSLSASGVGVGMRGGRAPQAQLLRVLHLQPQRARAVLTASVAPQTPFPSPGEHPFRNPEAPLPPAWADPPLPGRVAAQAGPRRRRGHPMGLWEMWFSRLGRAGRSWRAPLAGNRRFLGEAGPAPTRSRAK